MDKSFDLPGLNIEELVRSGVINAHNTTLEVIASRWGGPERTVVTVKEAGTGKVNELSIPNYEARQYEEGSQLPITLYSCDNKNWYRNPDDVMTVLTGNEAIQAQAPFLIADGIQERESYQ